MNSGPFEPLRAASRSGPCADKVTAAGPFIASDTEIAEIPTQRGAYGRLVRGDGQQASRSMERLQALAAMEYKLKSLLQVVDTRHVECRSLAEAVSHSADGSAPHE